MARDVICAHSAVLDTAGALAELKEQLADIVPVVVLFFASYDHDGIVVEAALRELAPDAEIIGCSTAGEFTDTAYTQGGISVMAMSSAKVKRCASAMADYAPGGQGVEAAVHEATGSIARKLQVDLRELDPSNWVGVVLTDGMNGNEEEANAVLGHVAPFLSFVGASAGDNFRIKETLVYHQGKKCSNGSVLLLMELAVPFKILKSCSFEPTDTRLRIDRVQGRVVYEIDGKPALVAYAEKVGVKPEELGTVVFMANPIGIVIDKEPWVRSPVMALPDGGLMFGCKVLEGSSLHLLRATDLVGDTKTALAAAVADLGAAPSAALLFNCAHRCMEIQVRHLEPQFQEALASIKIPVAGYNSYGESWLAHMNQTLIGLIIG